LESRIVWEPRSPRRNGVRNLKMGGKPFTLIADPEHRVAEVEAATAFTLRLNGRDLRLPAGRSIVPLE